MPVRASSSAANGRTVDGADASPVGAAATAAGASAVVVSSVRAWARRVRTCPAAKSPKCRILTKRGGKTCSRKRRMNSTGGQAVCALPAGAKDDGRVVDVDEAVVRDGDAMGVADRDSERPAAARRRGAWRRRPSAGRSSAAGVGGRRDRARRRRARRRRAPRRSRPRNLPRKSAPSTWTGKRKSGAAATQRVPSRERPPPVTMQWTCGWKWRSRVQVWSTVVIASSADGRATGDRGRASRAPPRRF